MADQRQVSQAEAESFSETNNMIYFETSAKEGDNIEYIFNYTAERLLEFYGDKNDLNLKRQMNPTTQLQSQNFSEIRIEKQRKKCC